MVVHRKKKVGKYRSHTTHGGGHRKKRRGAGSRGGRGNAGTGKRAGHKRRGVVLGRSGFKPRGRHTSKTTSLNVGHFTLTKLTLLEQKGKVSKEGDLFVIDLAKLRIQKVLGAGTLSVKLKLVGACSDTAAAKIKEAGGQVVELAVAETVADAQAPSEN